MTFDGDGVGVGTGTGGLGVWSPSSVTLSEHPCDICGEQLSLHGHGESLAATAPDLTVLRRHLQSLRKRGLLERAAVLQLAACGGL